ncbi:GH3 family domain-containing protein [Xanthocytophaga agilis]|uniref:GH3 auxin-responsive promoter family protein n=1 Tax=Xanthocytophaga agilis TaxID=3048010 RepID=A0AAE3R9Y7_9BACT|nr:GH3 auxin-responsive promoter family protein [Xanthocytophaga agilis]MDJ1504237.1 GH3 auxin-responsive promoter family protein [Xanthocytophaga agilis]
MPVIGALLKKLIEFSDTFVNEGNPAEAQEKVLRALLEKAKDTAFGQHYQFEAILASPSISDAFAARVPFHNYDKMHSEWWHKVLAGEADITWPGKPHYFALSSGTTSHSKHIPVTDEMLASIRTSAIRQIMSLSEFNLPPSFFEKQIMMLGSSTHLKEKEDHKEGEISGISASNIPFWFRSYYKPGIEISSIDDWDTRIEQIAQHAKEWDIGSLSGIPAWIELMLKRVIEYHKVDTIHDIWPNLMVYASGGVALGPYKSSLDKLFGRPMIYTDTYLASEGFLAFQHRPDTESMRPVFDNGIYFEFVPFEENIIQEDGGIDPSAKAISIEYVQEGIDYVLLISTVSGAWRYMIGDTVRFTDKSRYEFIISGRTKFFLNAVGCQLSVNQMEQGIQELNQHFSMDITEFTVAEVRRDGQFIHQWYVGANTVIDNEQIAVHLDHTLCEINKNYAVARSRALKDVKVTVIPTQLFHDWNAATKKLGGQTKVPRVMKEQQFNEWEEFVKSHSEEVTNAMTSSGDK